MSTIKITIPDGTPQEKIKHLETMKELFIATAKLVGEKFDTKQIDDIIRKLKKSK